MSIASAVACSLNRPPLARTAGGSCSCRHDRSADPGPKWRNAAGWTTWRSNKVSAAATGQLVTGHRGSSGLAALSAQSDPVVIAAIAGRRHRRWNGASASRASRSSARHCEDRRPAPPACPVNRPIGSFRRRSVHGTSWDAAQTYSRAVEIGARSRDQRQDDPAADRAAQPLATRPSSFSVTG